MAMAVHQFLVVEYLLDDAIKEIHQAVLHLSCMSMQLEMVHMVDTDKAN